MGNYSNKKTHSNGILKNEKTHVVVFRVISKLMLSYLEQQGNQR